MIVLANDGLEKEGIAKFEEANIGIDTKKRKPEQLLEEISGFDGLIVRSATKVTKDVIQAGKDSLKVIGRAGVGYDNVDVAAAFEQGIVVKYAPNGNTISTAEVAFTLMLCVSHKIPQAHYHLSNGIWVKDALEGTEVTGKTLGIIGCGRIGQRLSKYARGLDMRVIGYDTKPASDSGIEYMAKEDVLQQADYISIHTGGKKEIIGATELALMKPTAYLINASRGENVNEEALYDALKNRKIAGAGIDCHLNEPKEDYQKFEIRFRGLDNVVLSSHLGASSEEAKRKTGIEIAEVIIAYLKDGNWDNAVEIGDEVIVEQKPTYPVFINHDDVPGMFAQIDGIFGAHNINIRNHGGRKLGKTGRAIAVYLVEKQPGSQVLTAIRAIPGVYSIKS